MELKVLRELAKDVPFLQKRIGIKIDIILLDVQTFKIFPNLFIFRKYMGKSADVDIDINIVILFIYNSKTFKIS